MELNGENKNPGKLQYLLAFGIIYLVWGSTYLVLKISVTALAPFLVIAIRTTLAGILLMLLVYPKAQSLPSLSQVGNAAFVGSMLFCGAHSALAWAEQRVDSGVAAVVISTIPLWMIILEWLGPCKKVPKRIQLFGLAAGFAGILVLSGFGGSKAATSGLDIRSLLLLQLSAFLWAAGSIYGRYRDMPKSASMSAGLQLLFGGLVTFLMSWLTGDLATINLTEVSMSAFYSVLYLTIFGSLLAFSAYNWLMRNTSPVLVSTYTYVNPVIAIFVGVILGQEALSASTIYAVPLIIAGVIMIALPSWREQRSLRTIPLKI